MVTLILKIVSKNNIITISFPKLNNFKRKLADNEPISAPNDGIR